MWPTCREIYFGPPLLFVIFRLNQHFNCLWPAGASQESVMKTLHRKIKVSNFYSPVIMPTNQDEQPVSSVSPAPVPPAPSSQVPFTNSLIVGVPPSSSSSSNENNQTNSTTAQINNTQDLGNFLRHHAEQ